MKIVRLSRRTRRSLAFLSLIIVLGGFGYYAWASIAVSLSSSATVKGATTAALTSAVITYPAPNSTTTSCTVTGSTASCPNVDLTLGGSATEAGNYTVTLTFTASPAGAQINMLCSTTGALVCGTPSQTVFATGSPQTATEFIRPGGTGSGTATITLTG